MFLKLCKHSIGVKIRVRLVTAAVIGLGGSVELAEAWQFRELDPSQQAVTAESAELVPTQEAFLAPVVDAATFQKAQREQTNSLADGARETVAPTPGQPHVVPPPAPKPIKSVENPEPVPMADLIELEPVKKGTDSDAANEDQHPFADFTIGSHEGVTAQQLHPAVFRGAQPARTTVTELLARWGEPSQETVHADESKSLIFHDSYFKQIEVTVRENRVTSMLLHLQKPQEVAGLEQELALTHISPVPVPDELGEILGLAYPESGLMFSFAEDATEHETVDAILVEEVSAEMFRLRAQYDFGHNYQRSLHDLQLAIELDGKDAESYWLQAQYLDAVGKTRDAIKSVQKAIRLKPTSALYRLTRARLYAKTNQLQTALDEVRAVLSEIEMPNDVAAKAHNLLGDLLAVGADADHQLALKSHLKAIDLAAKAVDDQRFAIRRRAKQVLIDAHLSVARDIAMGNFQRQAEVIPKWLLRAAEVADEFISDDSGDELIQLHIFRETLAAYAEIQISNIDAAIATEEAIETTRDFIADGKDELYKMQVQRILAETLLHAARIERSRGKHDVAIGHANNAIALLESTNAQWDISPHGQYLQCQLYFVLGSLYAIKDQNHREAVAWYTKARNAVIASNTVSPLYSLRGHGEMYVSMGLSYWEIGEYDTAIQITKSGTELMSEAVENGSLEIKSMAVPYGNLAIMHSKMGRSDKSEEYAKLVAKVENLQQGDTMRR